MGKKRGCGEEMVGMGKRKEGGEIASYERQKNKEKINNKTEIKGTGNKNEKGKWSEKRSSRPSDRRFHSPILNQIPHLRLLLGHEIRFMGN